METVTFELPKFIHPYFVIQDKTVLFIGSKKMCEDFMNESSMKERFTDMKIVEETEEEEYENLERGTPTQNA